MNIEKSPKVRMEQRETSPPVFWPKSLVPSSCLVIHLRTLKNGCGFTGRPSRRHTRRWARLFVTANPQLFKNMHIWIKLFETENKDMNIQRNLIPITRSESPSKHPHMNTLDAWKRLNTYDTLFILTEIKIIKRIMYTVNELTLLLSQPDWLARRSDMQSYNRERSSFDIDVVSNAYAPFHIGSLVVLHPYYRYLIF